MRLSEHWAKFIVSADSHAILILDVSESAREKEKEIIGLTKGILEKLHGLTELSLYFLGNPKPYPAALFATTASRWIEENRGRGSILGPIFEQAKVGPITKAALIGAGEIFDIDDWQNHPLLKQLLLVNVGAPLQPKGGPVKELRSASADDICRHLQSRLKEISITGPGFLPLRWDNKNYTLYLQENGMSLLCIDTRNCCLKLKCLATEIDGLHATITYTTGEEIQAKLVQAESFQKEPLRIATLSSVEAGIFQKAKAREPFKCPHCRQLHVWDTFECDNTGYISGAPIYESLPRQIKGFLQLKETDTGVEVYEHTDNIIWMGSDKAAVVSEGRSIIYQFDSQSSSWIRKKDIEFEAYTQIGENSYVIVI